MSTTDTVGPYPIDATVTDPSGVGSVTLVYRLGAGDWVEVPMALSGGTWTAAIPGMDAGNAADYYVRALDQAGQTSTAPAGAPGSFFTFRISAVFYSTDCEGTGDPAWQLGVSGGLCHRGIWVRADPVGTFYGLQPIQPEDDHTRTRV